MSVASRPATARPRRRSHTMIGIQTAISTTRTPTTISASYIAVFKGASGSLARAQNRIVKLAPRRRPWIRGDDLRARILHAGTVVDELVHLGDERLQIGPRLRTCQHDRDLTEHTVGRPVGEFGKRPALDLLVSLGQLSAHHGAALRTEHLDGVLKAGCEPPR